MASSAPVPLHVPAAPEAADAEQLQAQQQALLTLGCRTMALPIGRGALTLGECTSMCLWSASICLCSASPWTCMLSAVPRPGNTLNL